MAHASPYATDICQVDYNRLIIFTLFMVTDKNKIDY